MILKQESDMVREFEKLENGRRIILISLSSLSGILLGLTIHYKYIADLFV